VRDHEVDDHPPPRVAALAGGRPLRLQWRNEVGGTTWAVGDPPSEYVKWSPSPAGPDLAAEVARLRWLATWTPVPRVLQAGADGDGTWLRTAAMPGRSAVDRRWLAEPATAVAAIGRGLRAFHDAVPVAVCPSSWSAAARVADASRRAAAGRLEPGRWHLEHRGLGVAGALAVLADAPDADRLAVCHGDACSPNCLLAEDGSWAGHVDLVDAGVADRWADLAVATWSSDWNYGPGWDRHLLDAYGVDPDPERTAWYRLLWDLGP